MENNNSIITTKNLNDLQSYIFRIPLYQRPYAWQEEHIVQLLEDLKTFYGKYKNQDKKYYLGNIVVSNIDNNYFDVIDGQQRLTTLYLLLKIANKECFELEYEIREEDNIFLKNFDINNPTDTFKDNIKAIQNWQQENKNYNLDDLLQKIEITLTQIPKEVDVVKYFEVMNNRGKQLEKHQILKAKFLDILKDDKEYNYAKIWDYCSQMSILVEDLIYYNDFKKDDKIDKAFEKLRQKLLSFNFDEIESKNTKIFKIGYEDKKVTILDIIEPSKVEDKENKNTINTDKEDDFKNRKEYKSIIKFPIFLIQVLKIFIAKNNLQNSDFKSLDEIIVNDRYLLDYFFKDKTHKEFLFDEELAKEFVIFLFKARILFDYYIFKRNDKDEPEFIARENKNLLMIELLFNVSAPQYFAQDWAAVVLRYLLNNERIKDLTKTDENLIKFLEVFDNEMLQIRLSGDGIIDFINKKIKEIKNPQENLANKQVIDEKKLYNILNQGTSTPHYWFYKLDYLLWKDYDFNQDFKNKFDFDYTTIKNKYRLSRLNSIEHIFPQSKKSEWKDENSGCENCPKKSDERVDCFGNLALISNHLNSALIDEPFNNKRTRIQKQLNNGTIESLKMLLIYSKYDEWNAEKCKEHQGQMVEILTGDKVKE